MQGNKVSLSEFFKGGGGGCGKWESGIGVRKTTVLSRAHLSAAHGFHFLDATNLVLQTFLNLNWAPWDWGKNMKYCIKDELTKLTLYSLSLLPNVSELFPRYLSTRH